MRTTSFHIACTWFLIPRGRSATHRAEYLGPSPHVAEYRFHEDRQEAFVEWWDAYLKVKWINDTTWRIDVYFEERVQGWVSELRGDYARNLDLFDYAGTESGK